LVYPSSQKPFTAKIPTEFPTNGYKPFPVGCAQHGSRRYIRQLNESKMFFINIEKAANQGKKTRIFISTKVVSTKLWALPLGKRPRRKSEIREPVLNPKWLPWPLVGHVSRSFSESLE
jgi:hypothetical protein